MAKKERIDVLLVEYGFFDSREKAKRAIMAGLVFVENERVDKAGTKIDVSAQIEVKGNRLNYVSRGGLKLEKAIRAFRLDLAGKTAIDVGASTGGFTDCMLQHGVKKVYAVDVGYNQLAWKLRQDERVIVMERVNFRYIDAAIFQEDKPSFATVDVSFISLKLILPKLTEIITNDGLVVALVKPQFEAGKEDVGKKGIVRDQHVHMRVLDEMIVFALDLGFSVMGLTYSPVTGKDGNIEFLLLLKWNQVGRNMLTDQTESVVKDAHDHLNADGYRRGET